MMIPLEHKLPELWALACDVAAEIKAGQYSDWPPLLERMQPLLDPELIVTMDQTIPGWKNIAILQDGRTAKHTLMVLVICLNLPEYMAISLATQHEIEWAAVLHDLDKKFNRNDTAHPFRSAAVVAKIMPTLGFELQPGVASSEIEGWSALVMAAQRAEGERMVHDHTHLEKIVQGLRQIWGEGTPAMRVMKAILFHQSLPTLKDWTNAVLMTDAEIRTYLSPEDMDVLGPLLIADSDSWNIFDPPRHAYLDELRANVAATRQRLGV